ncbi:Histidine--tRNA ligase protein [Marine Group I thaumarchaeote SCGC AAA799-E16]|uniref:Histidine--tRNA ligase n=5 Tax=Marine Group I TaxID=905826 RepID=A0A087S786_9ARCH|nr:Histidine--tRNA ligase protein [Marine Group I thaumarchaeote SCGC AAA799-E16]KFM17310.1 Histidine--tRNA ligase protein [Marine Group I thaumarchaeote SCGC AAA799-D11]KFM19331.1 Histidine--tRNA ligase protein [Marine Group I thaumarchaeote SCGC RSA3]KFM21590.1 Histidine--tRNA ligase protein [Marine Group I thaumarchaeote SCGC AAA799-B03]
MELPRGMKDFEAIENSNIEHVRSHFKKLSNLYGFSFMEPSVLESLSTLETKSGPAIRDEIYYFKDKGDREVALRFDFTMGLTRYATAQKSMKLPAKISAFGGVFRYDEPQKGRYRYFHQWDIEVYGKKTLESEAEIIELTSRLFDSLLLKDIVIDINHRNLVESYINKIFETTDSDKVADILRAIDKIAKKSKDEILTEFTKKGYDTAKLEKILEFSQVKGTISEVEKNFDTEQLESWDELKQLFDSLENRGVSNVRINFGIVRGLDYYSGMVFEVFDKNSKLGALAGGGRYDTLTKAFGRDDIGATGVAGGVERIILTMQEQKIIPEVLQNRVAVVYINDEMQKVAHSITSLLRLNNIPSDIDLAGRNLKKQMDHAGNARYAIIVGPQELENGNVVLHDMKDGKEGTISLEKLTEDPNSVLNLEKP